MKIGIDQISFYVPHTFIEMKDLALARNEDPNKYLIGLGQEQMAVPNVNQDPVSLAANAAYPIVKDAKEDIDLILFATETGIDFSKAAATSLHALLDLPHQARAIELKQACYSATAALYLAANHVKANPNKKALVIASDISRYGLNTAGEPTQGAGSVAMIVSANPRILSFDFKFASYTDDIWDFWRPSYSDVAFVDGHYSNEQYKRLFQETSKQYMKTYEQSFNNFDAFLFHIPYTKLGRKALQSFSDDDSIWMKRFNDSILYNKRVGNIYTGSLYLHLISLLENTDLPKNAKLGFYSYGSGAVAEFFSAELCDNYQDHLRKDEHMAMLDQRRKLSIKEYEQMFKAQVVEDGSHQIFEDDMHARFQLKEIKNHRRYYQKNQ